MALDMYVSETHSLWKWEIWAFFYKCLYWLNSMMTCAKKWFGPRHPSRHVDMPCGVDTKGSQRWIGTSFEAYQGSIIDWINKKGRLLYDLVFFGCIAWMTARFQREIVRWLLVQIEWFKKECISSLIDLSKGIIKLEILNAIVNRFRGSYICVIAITGIKTPRAKRFLSNLI